MATFGIVAEGKSDFPVLENILYGYFEENEDFIQAVRYLQPLLDKTDQVTHGGWHEVLQYCNSEELKKALIQNDYIVLQIDTDRSFDTPFDVPHPSPMDIQALVESVKERLICEIGADYQTISNRILFAIAVHQTECWLLPLHDVTPTKANLKDCEGALSKKIGKFEKNIPTYNRLSDKFLRKKNLTPGFNTSFNLFLAELEKIELVV